MSIPLQADLSSVLGKADIKDEIIAKFWINPEWSEWGKRLQTIAVYEKAKGKRDKEDVTGGSPEAHIYESSDGKEEK